MTVIDATIAAMSCALSFRDVTLASRLRMVSADIPRGSSIILRTPDLETSMDIARLITGIVMPDSGRVVIGEHGDEPAGYFRKELGIVPPDGGLLSNLKFWENITLPLLYHSGVFTEDDELQAINWLNRLGFGGRPMTQPAHLTPRERRIGGMVRMFVTRPEIVVYCNCFDELHQRERSALLEVAGEFHDMSPVRTSLYLTSSTSLVAEIRADATLTIEPPRKP